MDDDQVSVSRLYLNTQLCVCKKPTVKIWRRLLHTLAFCDKGKIMVKTFLVWKSFMLEYLNYVNDLTDLASITFVHNDIVIRSGSSIIDSAINFVWVIIWGKINFIDTKIKRLNYITFDIEYFTKNFLCKYTMWKRLRSNILIISCFWNKGKAKKLELAYITVVDFCWPRKSCRQNQKRTLNISL